MASSSITFRRRNVTFTTRPPQIVRYSYHGGGGGTSDASTSLSSSSGISRYPPMMPPPPPMPMPRNEPTYQNTSTSSSSSISSSPPIYDNVPKINGNNNSIVLKSFSSISPRNPPLPKTFGGDERKMPLQHRWSTNEGIEKVDVIQRHSGITHVNIGDSKNFYAVEEEDDDDEEEEMAMHLYECIEQFNTACDKILGARQLIDTDTSLTSSDREKLLRLVHKSISQGRGRLENFDQSSIPAIPSSNRTTTLSGGTGSNASMGGHLASPSPTPSEPKLSIDANFINRYGPQIMHLLQENMAKQN